MRGRLPEGDLGQQHRAPQPRVPEGVRHLRVRGSLRLSEDFGVTPGKLEELKGRIARLRIDVSKIEETFSRGGGKGGQKVNKSNNRVQLYYEPLGLRVACHRERSRSLNRFFALRELVDQAEMRLSPETSERLKEQERIRRNKARSASRSQKKYSAGEVSNPPPAGPQVPPA